MPSATIHTRFAALATRLIDRHGRTMLLVTETSTGSDFDPQISQSVEEVIGVEVRAKSVEVGGDLVFKTGKAYLIDSTVSITNDMRIRDGSFEYPVLEPGLLSPGMTRILYKVEVGDGVGYETLLDGFEMGWDDVDVVGWNDTQPVGWQ